MNRRFHLYSWGANSHGQLGHGDIEEDELLLPREIDLSLSEMDLNDVVKIVGGAGHTLILNRLGQVFSCGWNDKGQTGVSSPSVRFLKVEALGQEKIIDVVCGWDSSMALTEDGDVYVWGSNSHGQLGIKGVDKICEPRKLTEGTSGRKFKRISMGLRHSAIVSSDGNIFVSGASNKGQLGVLVSGARRSETFVTVSELQSVREVACGQNHTVIITESNELFAWGDNKHGQLGINPEELKIATTPIKIANDSVVNQESKIYCGWTHTCLCSSVVYSWGRNSYGQLGRPRETSINDCWKAKIVDTKDDIIRLSLGSEHNLALRASGAILTWGWNEHGNCGVGNTLDVFTPVEIKLPTGSLIGTGAGHSFALVYHNEESM